MGESFENKLADLYPPLAPPKPAETKPAADSTADSAKSDTAKSDSKPAAKTDPLSGMDLSGGARPSTMGRGKGNVFIVSHGSRAVLWSIYEPPKNTTSGELTKTAERVVKHLQEDLNGKKPATDIGTKHGGGYHLNLCARGLSGGETLLKPY